MSELMQKWATLVALLLVVAIPAPSSGQTMGTSGGNAPKVGHATSDNADGATATSRPPFERFEAGAPERSALVDINTRRLDATATGMQFLTGWAVANIAVGSAGWAVADDDQWKNFHLMNAGWNVVNLALGASGWWGAATTDPAGLDLETSLREVIDLENLLLLNAGLDVAYVIGGSALWWAGTERGRDDWTGWGQSVVVQGAFLLGFDLVMWAVEKSFRDELLELY